MKSLWALSVYSMEPQQNFGDSVKISVSKSIFQGQLKAMTKTVNGNQPRTIFLQFLYKTTFYSKIYTGSVCTETNFLEKFVMPSSENVAVIVACKPSASAEEISLKPRM